MISEITSSKVNQFKMARSEKVSKASTNRDLAVLKNMFNLAIRWEWLESNPVSRIPLFEEGQGRVRFLSDQEFDNLLNACPEWLQPIVLVARHTGLRRENILNLKWEQVDFFRRVILIDQNQMKNGERIGIPLNDTVLQKLQDHISSSGNHSPYCFHHGNGKRYFEIKRQWKKVLYKVGISDFRFHDLRHTFASSLVQRGVDLYVVQRLLGHKTQAMTQRYSHLAPENLRSAVMKLDSKTIPGTEKQMN
jgi:integrase